MIVALVLTWLAMLAGAWLGWQLLRQNGRILLRLDEQEKRLDQIEFGEGEASQGLPVGSDAPAFELPDLSGNTRTLGEFRGHLLLLVFFNPACTFCRELPPKLASFPLSSNAGEGRSETRPLEPKPRILIISVGSAEANRILLDAHQLTCPVLLQKEMEVAAAYKANGTPTAYLINAEGKIASELAIGAEALLALAAEKSGARGPFDRLRAGPKPEPQQHPEASIGENSADLADRFSRRSLARSQIKRDGLKAGTRAPHFRLPRLDGRGDLDLEDLRGRCVLLVFSRPHCGPCHELATQLQKFHREHAELQVVMISKGEPKETRTKVKELGLTFPIVLQQHWEISRRYAMFATPIAYLIDETGIIAQDVAIGADAIVDLMARAETLFHNSRDTLAPA